MKKASVPLFLSVICCFAIHACKKDDGQNGANTPDTYSAIKATFGANIDPENLYNYAAQTRPAYITKDNSGGNPVTDKGATLGRVLFYDKNLSVDNTVACASCHKQANAFGDDVVQSQGVNGVTTRHAMRLVNARFSQELKFFWDERASSLENQTTRPIQDHSEMGYSGQNGDPGINDLIAKLSAIQYYKELFTFVYGDTVITEARLQSALSQFVRSIQSFDSKFDAGLVQAGNINADFPNFSSEENQGKRLFLNPPANPAGGQTGAGCQGCHRAPEFDIDPNTLNNGIVGVAGSTTGTDLLNTRAPSLRDVVNRNGAINGPLMHDGSRSTLSAVIDHYNAIARVAANTNLDPRLMPNGQPQRLQLTAQQKNSIVAFISTLSGSDVYTNKKWADPFLK